MTENLFNEQALLLQTAAGSERAFHTIVRYYHQKVFSHALTFTKSYPEAEEITQDIFLKVWEQRQRLPEIISFKDYLYILGRNQIISAMRRSAMKTGPSSDDPLENILLPDKQYQFKEIYQLLLDGVQQLPPQQRAVFTMSRLEHLSHEQIAKELQVSRHTVNWHIVQALNFLRNYLGHYSEHLVIILAGWLLS
jgi:RNA polymerase sigma-70 factor (family 1)